MSAITEILTILAQLATIIGACWSTYDHRSDIKRWLLKIKNIFVDEDEDELELVELHEITPV